MLHLGGFGSMETYSTEYGSDLPTILGIVSSKYADLSQSSMFSDNYPHHCLIVLDFVS